MLSFKQFLLEKKNDDDPCWKGYRQLGMKKKNGKEVPNCIPEETESLDEASFADTMKKAITAHERGDESRAKYHLENARTASFALPSTKTSKNKEMYEKYKKLSRHYNLFKEETESLDESEYQGRDVKLNKPMKGDVKKSKVYVKNDKGNIVKVEFGDPNMTIKKHIPARRKSFRARHNCDNPGPKWKARYWSCKAW